ncbi:TnsD family transposase [Acidithiobacillus ferruginosus]|uniref:TnsD family transposase n=1 Tax=Acidithiobacillus ferruginosus TaxID=3063951 RepID=A0ACD5IEK8_9PROT|nr:transposase [Acidithiobacillus ferruginosus]MBU2855894.1 transposase [Acidithiobacillus ferrooxidans]MBU2859592.1 transposase [Acidithiobacillus ferrooxidans]
MLAYFPEIYPDELLYSVLARYHRHVCSGSPKHTLYDLFGETGVRATVGLQSHVAALSQRIPTDRGLGPERLTRDFTLYRYYTAFEPKSVGQFALASLVDGPADAVHVRLGIAASAISAPAYLRYCPICLGEMLSRYGEGYWRRSHQLPGVLVCPDHGAALADSAVSQGASNQHEFIAADQKNCSPVAALPSWASSPRQVTLLQEIAKRSAALLDHPPVRSRFCDWGAYYRSAVIDRGFGKGKENVAQNLLREAILSLLEPVIDLIPSGLGGDWPTAMVRKHRKAFHPLRHVLFQIFLDKRSPQRRPAPPFGKGPWPCFNRLADHYGQNVIHEIAVRHDQDRVIGRFSCACGFVYSREVGSRSSPRILDFGPLLDSQIRQKVAEGLGLRAVARYLAIDPGTVRLHASRLGLNVPWKPLAARHSRTLVPDRDAIRTRWLDMQQNHADLSRRRLALLLSKEHSWLYRHDREWLEQHSPTALHKKWSDQRVDWETLDRSMAAQLRKAAREITREVPPQRVTQAALERKLGRPRWMSKRQAKLPKSIGVLGEVMETTDAFRLRRIVWATAELHRQALPTRAWRVRRLAGLPSIASPSVETALAALEIMAGSSEV